MFAEVAQLVEQCFRKAEVVSSILTFGSILVIKLYFMFDGLSPNQFAKEGLEMMRRGHGDHRKTEISMGQSAIVEVGGEILDGCKIIPLPGREIDGRPIIMVHKSRADGTTFRGYFFADKYREAENGSLIFTEECMDSKLSGRAA